MNKTAAKQAKVNYREQRRESVDTVSNQIRGLSNEVTEKTDEKVNSSEYRAKNVLNSSTEHIRDFDLEEARRQVKKKIQLNPAAPLAAAVLFGLLIGLLIGKTKKLK